MTGPKYHLTISNVSRSGRNTSYGSPAHYCNLTALPHHVAERRRSKIRFRVKTNAPPPLLHADQAMILRMHVGSVPVHNQETSADKFVNSDNALSLGRPIDPVIPAVFCRFISMFAVYLIACVIIIRGG
jgi:hypothetical protein